MKLLLALSLLLLPALPVYAAETGWQEVSPGVKLRLLSADQRAPDGTVLVGLEIDMPANTRTYWRVPGETGIATELDNAGSIGISGQTIDWPYPAIDQRAGYTDFVYWGPTLLPITLATSGVAPVLNLAVVMGICSDICVPAQAKFALPLRFDKPDPVNGLRIRQALALAPLPWTGNEAAIGAVRLSKSANAVLVTLTDPAIDPASLIATADAGEPLLGAPEPGPENGTVLLPVLGTSEESSLENRPVEITFMTNMGAFTATRTVEATAAP